MVYSWNDIDPADADSAQHHGPLQRGSASLNLLGRQREVPPDPADIQSFTVAVNNVGINSYQLKPQYKLVTMLSFSFR